MLRAFGAFLLMFSMLSLVVHLNGTVLLFGVGALAMFVIDLLAARANPDSRSSRMRKQPLI